MIGYPAYGAAPQDALARWDNEGGALAPPVSLTKLAQLRRRILIRETLVMGLMSNDLAAPRDAVAQSSYPHPNWALAGPKSSEVNKLMTDLPIFPAAAIATFNSHAAAETAIRELGLAGFDITRLSVVGKGYHTDEHVTGFYNQGDRIRFWGTRGAFWGGVWSLFFGGMFVTVPLIGPVVVTGYLAAMAIAALEGAAVIGGISAISAALYGVGIPANSVLRYETVIKTDGYLVMAHDTPERIAIARKVLADAGAEHIDVHEVLKPYLGGAPATPAHGT